jgi:hypothetical protein
MAGNIKVNNVVLASIFDPYVMGTSPGALGLIDGGVDVGNNVYAPLSFGSAAPATGITVIFGSVQRDLNTFFAAAGTARYVPVIPFGVYQALTVNSHDAGATLTCTFNSDGTWGITLINVPSGSGSNSGTPLSGLWAPSNTAGIGSSYNIRVTPTISVSNTAGGSPSFTAATGFVNLGSGFTITVATSHIINSGQGGFTSLAGHYLIEIQATAGGPITSSTLTISEVEADIS